jgi:hypothetical protein
MPAGFYLESGKNPDININLLLVNQGDDMAGKRERIHIEYEGPFCVEGPDGSRWEWVIDEEPTDDGTIIMPDGPLAPQDIQIPDRGGLIVYQI